MPEDDLDSQVERYGWGPNGVDIPGVPTGLRRKWVLRVSAQLPGEDTLFDMTRSFESSVRQIIADVLQLLPKVSSVRLDDHHLVLQIDCPRADASKGDEAAITTWNVLRAADAQWPVEDIEGIPKRDWLAMC